MYSERTARKYNLQEEELQKMLDRAERDDQEHHKVHLFTNQEEITLLESIKRKGYLDPLDYDEIFTLAERQYYWDTSRDHVKDPISFEWIEDFLARRHTIEDPWKGSKDPYFY